MQNSDGTLVVPAWYDPKGRIVVWDAATIGVGFFIVGESHFAYATADQIVFEGATREAATKWPGRLKPIREADLTVSGRKHRLYFARPLPGSPRVRENQLTKFTDLITGPGNDVAGLVGNLASRVGLAADVASLIGNLLAMPGEFTDQRQGCRNGDAVRAKLEAGGIQSN